MLDQVVTGEQTAEFSDDGNDLRGVRLAFAPRQFLDLVDSEVEIRFREAVRQLRDAGAEVIEVDLGDDFNALIQTATWGIFAHETMGAISDFLRRHDVPTTFEAIYDGLKPQLRQAWGHIVLPGGAGAVSAEAYQTALNVSRPEIRRRLDKAFVAEGAQIILQPTTPCPAPLIEEQATVRVAGQDVSYLALANHTVSASSVGLPGISLPVGRSRAGLPLGLELDASVGSDRTLLVLARKIERVLGTASTAI
ncbi:Asp-tRNA(Asn)/Glu-tRNA(Gln) amidotransferase A subunit family amidase [Bradyrhizobium elkanii]